MKTFSAKKEEVERAWYVIDLEGLTVGRAATEIARLLRGKHKPIFTPHVDTGDFVICVNAEKVHFTGNKATQKEYYRHSGYPGGLKTQRVDKVLAKHPEQVVFNAVKGMLPKNSLGRDMLGKLRVYAGAEHPHKAQQPQNYTIER